MYAPRPFRIEDQEEILSFVAKNSLATIVSSTSPYPIASHIPILVVEEKLVGHIARSNPHVQELTSNPDVLLIFSGAQGYISSYAKDPEHLSILPTWDYQIVHAKAKISFVDEEALLHILDALMKHHEASQPKSLDLADYPQDVLRKKMKAIVGFEIQVEEWTACFRLNQNRTPQERENIKSHLKENRSLVDAVERYNP